MFKELKEFPDLLKKELGEISDYGMLLRKGGWTVRQVVHHLIDSHLLLYVAMKQTLSEEKPDIVWYEPADWAVFGDYEASIDEAFIFLKLVHSRMVNLLESLDEEKLEMSVEHPMLGKRTIKSIGLLIPSHGLRHLKLIKEAAKAKNSFDFVYGSK